MEGHQAAAGKRRTGDRYFCRIFHVRAGTALRGAALSGVSGEVPEAGGLPEQLPPDGSEPVLGAEASDQGGGRQQRQAGGRDCKASWKGSKGNRGREHRDDPQNRRVRRNAHQGRRRHSDALQRRLSCLPWLRHGNGSDLLCNGAGHEAARVCR